MKKRHITSALLAAMALANTAVAADTNTTQQTVNDVKHWNVGVGTYALVIDDEDEGDDDFTGFGLSATYAFSDKVAIRGEYYSLEHDDESKLEVSGFDLVAYYGTNLMSPGFKAYIGGGVYSESLEYSSFDVDEDFSGVQLNGGIGYNWEMVSLDFVLGLRSVGDYEDFAGDSADLSAATSSLIISARF
ncbi:outer membrane beta-barrel protein [Thalassotalea sp. ND16A]|uniref:outer membrane beta-barrel protein n=1 Tax=Thalassotalea sp. ND16A TaxID=1535422 RepID=UPI00051A14BC|nr:outer membrane beta-barrel protein [Thalassotalea sp. ND16A]KGJ92193.1 hypothetical protein ND16A_1712 [Thalassotalea sp. ND16A]